MTPSVVTLQFGDLPYFADSVAINSAYCARHGLSWDVIHPPLYNDRHQVWGKVGIIDAFLRDSEFVLYLDADAVFVDHGREIDWLISRLGRKQFIFAQDRSGQANTGVILARQSATSARMLAEWSAIPRRDARHAFRWPLEQGALNKHLLGRYSHDIELVQPDEPDPFIRHYAGVSLTEKTRLIQETRRQVLPLPMS